MAALESVSAPLSAITPRVAAVINCYFVIVRLNAINPLVAGPVHRAPLQPGAQSSGICGCVVRQSRPPVATRRSGVRPYFLSLYRAKNYRAPVVVQW
jgi:hypothetical protein